MLRGLRSGVAGARRVVAWVRQRLLRLASNEQRIRTLRSQGARIGEGCLIFPSDFSDLPYLIEIGNHVAISADTTFITHDASGWLFADHPEMDLFGTIRVGDNVYIGAGCTILPNTVIGSNCIIGTGSVVRGVIPDDSVVFGNPARVVMKTQLAKHLLVHHKNRLDTRHLPMTEKHRAIREHFGR
jgi:acetyltransferase-like isoleucine patch superfamily enzyme